MSEYRTTDLKHLSKWMSYVLRHAPETLGITLDSSGFTDLDTFVRAMQKQDPQITLARITAVVSSDPKKRYSIVDGKIRANQGHSAKVVPVSESTQPPKLLYHGTSTANWSAIQRAGVIQKMKRHHVHLSETRAVAEQVGKRHGKVVVLQVDAEAMHRGGHLFYVSVNGVWLTDEVPVAFLTVV